LLLRAKLLFIGAKERPPVFDVVNRRVDTSATRGTAALAPPRRWGCSLARLRHRGHRQVFLDQPCYQFGVVATAEVTAAACFSWRFHRRRSAPAKQHDLQDDSEADHNRDTDNDRHIVAFVLVHGDLSPILPQAQAGHVAPDPWRPYEARVAAPPGRLMGAGGALGYNGSYIEHRTLSWPPLPIDFKFLDLKPPPPLGLQLRCALGRMLGGPYRGLSP
jgi:hypothetical protein